MSCACCLDLGALCEHASQTDGCKHHRQIEVLSEQFDRRVTLVDIDEYTLTQRHRIECCGVGGERRFSTSTAIEIVEELTRQASPGALAVVHRCCWYEMQWSIGPHRKSLGGTRGRGLGGTRCSRQPPRASVFILQVRAMAIPSHRRQREPLDRHCRALRARWPTGQRLRLLLLCLRPSRHRRA